MINNNFEQNGFIVDLSDAHDASEIIFQLSNILDNPEAKNKNICLKLGDVNLNKSQLLSVKALINSLNSELTVVNSTSVLTNASAQSLDIETEELTNEVPVEEQAEEIEEVEEPKQTENFETVENKPENEEKAEPEAETEDVSTDTISVDFKDVSDDKQIKEEELEDIKIEEDVSAEVENENKLAAKTKEDDIIEEKPEKIETKADEAPEVKIETRVVEEEIPDEIIETQEEKVESNYELFNPKEEVQFEKRTEAEDRLSSMLDEDIEEEEETPEIKERKEMESEISKLPTLYIQDTLRSGQTMSYDGNVVVIGDIHPGSEIIAKGDITIWGVLGGIAHAGARGNKFAKIRALKMNAIQLRISSFYARRPDTFNIPYIQRANEFTPEEARVEDEQIAIYKIYD